MAGDVNLEQLAASIRCRQTVRLAPIVPMPQPINTGSRGFKPLWSPLYSADQMREYGQQIDDAWRVKVEALCAALEEIAEGDERWTVAGLVAIARDALQEIK